MLVTNILHMTKAQRTRERLERAAIDLFEQRGYDAVTVGEIAAAAGVTEMTFFRNFAGKEAVLLDDPYDPSIAEAVGAQPRHLPPIVRVSAGIAAAWHDLPEPDSEHTRRRIRIAAASPSLRAGMWRNNAQTERVIVERLIADGVDPLAATVAASACLAGLLAALLDWAGFEGAAGAGGTLGDRIERALAIVAGSQS